MRISPYCPLILLFFALCSCEENDLINYEQQAQQKVCKKISLKFKEKNNFNILIPFFIVKSHFEQLNNQKNENINE